MKILRLFLVLAVVLVLGVVVAFNAVSHMRVKHRKAWKDRMLAEIALRTEDPKWTTDEVAVVRKKGEDAPDSSDSWFSQKLILMRNGDWIAYANICRKQNWRIDDLFLGKGSDGQWYYSTYHFCIEMVVLRMETQAEDLMQFVNSYYLRPFDGRSDVCLQKTWPPPSFGQGNSHGANTEHTNLSQ